MNLFIKHFRILFATLGGALSWLLGGYDSLIYALIAFVIIDYITGIFVAVKRKKVSSAVGLTGISKKVMIFVLVSIGSIIDQYIIASNNSIRSMIILFYISNEGISILENATRLGLSLPEKLRDILKQISDKSEK